MTVSILLDTNTLLDLRAYNRAKESQDAFCLELLGRREAIYNLVAQSPSNELLFYSSEMSVVEMTVVHLKHHLYEFARTVYHMPIEHLYERRNNALRVLRPEFNRHNLRNIFDGFHESIWPRHIRVIPNILSPAEYMTWRRRQEELFTRILQFESFETQDAYIVTSAIAAEIDEIWTVDDDMRRRINNLRNQHEIRLREQVVGDLPELFSSLNIPEAPGDTEILHRYAPPPNEE